MSAQKADQESPLWIKTPGANLVRYKPSGTYFARARVGGKLIRKSLRNHRFSTAKIKLNDAFKEEQQKLERTTAVRVASE